MTFKNLFYIILKIFGLLFLREIINEVIQLISTIYLYFNGSEGWTTFTSMFVSLFVLAIYGVLVFQLLFKTNRLVTLLKLDQNFDEHSFSFEQQNNLSINLSSKEILTISLIVIGGVILVQEIPNFCRQFYSYVTLRNNRYTSLQADMSYMVFSAFKIIIGLLILGERKRIIEIIEKKSKAGDDVEE